MFSWPETEGSVWLLQFYFHVREATAAPWFLLIFWISRELFINGSVPSCSPPFTIVQYLYFVAVAPSKGVPANQRLKIECPFKPMKTKPVCRQSWNLFPLYILDEREQRSLEQSKHGEKKVVMLKLAACLMLSFFLSMRSTDLRYETTNQCPHSLLFPLCHNVYLLSSWSVSSRRARVMIWPPRHPFMSTLIDGYRSP